MRLKFEMKKKSKPIIVYNLDNSIFGKYLSIKEASVSLDISIKTISRALNSDRKILKKQWIVQYL